MLSCKEQSKQKKTLRNPKSHATQRFRNVKVKLEETRGEQ